MFICSYNREDHSIISKAVTTYHKEGNDGIFGIKDHDYIKPYDILYGSPEINKKIFFKILDNMKVYYVRVSPTSSNNEYIPMPIPTDFITEQEFTI
jgi:hypothetical protein